MSRFERHFLREHLNGRVLVAAFGKHPGWDDHISDLGLDTESLAIAKQTLYASGITGLLASGDWDRLEASGDAIPFDHRFVWSRGRHSIIGAAWSSIDGIGRTRFPMVICVQAEVGSLLAIRLYLDTVERLAERCRSATDRNSVVRLLAETTAELNSATFAQEFVPDPRPSETSAAEEAAVLNGLLTAARTVGLPGTLRDSQAGAQCRLIAISDSLRENLRFWSGYAERSSTRTTLVIANGAGNFVDLIVDEPRPADLFCLRAGSRALPLTRPPDLLGNNRRLRQQCEDFLRAWRLGKSAVWKPRPVWWQSIFATFHEF
jgi:hypothetical protein